MKRLHKLCELAPMPFTAKFAPWSPDRDHALAARLNCGYRRELARRGIRITARKGRTGTVCPLAGLELP